MQPVACRGALGPAHVGSPCQPACQLHDWLAQHPPFTMMHRPTANALAACFSDSPLLRHSRWTHAPELLPAAPCAARPCQVTPPVAPCRASTCPAQPGATISEAPAPANVDSLPMASSIRCCWCCRGCGTNASAMMHSLWLNVCRQAANHRAQLSTRGAVRCNRRGRGHMPVGGGSTGKGGTSCRAGWKQKSMQRACAKRYSKAL